MFQRENGASDTFGWMDVCGVLSLLANIEPCFMQAVVGQSKNELITDLNTKKTEKRGGVATEATTLLQQFIKKR